MELRLNIYTDDTLTDVNRVVVADKLQIPYRVSMYVVSTFDKLDINNENDIISFLSKNVTLMDKILKATFKLTDAELECIDTIELFDVLIEIYKWCVTLISSIGGNKSKN